MAPLPARYADTRHTTLYSAATIVQEPTSEWDDVFDQLDWLPGGRLNLAHEAIDRHAATETAGSTALIWEGGLGEREEYTFAEMKTLSDLFACVLRNLGGVKGDRVFILLDSTPELFVAYLGALKLGAIACALPPELDADDARRRLASAGAKIVVTDPRVRRRLSSIVYHLFDLQHIIVVNKDGRDPFPIDPADLSYEEEMGKASGDSIMEATGQHDPALIDYPPSGGGEPLGALHRHISAAQHLVTGMWALCLDRRDVYWCTAPPGSPAWPSLGMLAPWTAGATVLCVEVAVDADNWADLVSRHDVSVAYVDADTAHKIGGTAPPSDDSPALRRLLLGAANDSYAVSWPEDAMGIPFRQCWSQAETGTVVVADAGEAPRRGPAGMPAPGLGVSIRDDDMDPLPAGEVGHLTLRPGWPSMFSTYWGDTEAYNSRFSRGWYVTGELARMDDEGYVWLEGPRK